MLVYQFTYNSTGKYAFVPDNNFVGTIHVFNSLSGAIAKINEILPYKLDLNASGNYILKGKAGKNYLSSIATSGNTITSIGWSTNFNSALSTPDINQAVSIALTINENF